ncbi:Uncharacterised protein [Mycobacteroides abscessus subsp. abscessus]|nr:Uncharacterised protein [Mycobacteroides abscessus subsp. abscessus]
MPTRSDYDELIEYEFDRAEASLEDALTSDIPPGHSLIECSSIPPLCPEILVTTTRRLNVITGVWGPPAREILENLAYRKARP